MFVLWDDGEWKNSAIAQMDFPPVSTEEIKGLQDRLKKLADKDDFRIRWWFEWVKEPKKDMRYRNVKAEKNFETGRRYGIFRERLEDVLRPQWYWEAEDGEWNGIFEEGLAEWCGDIIDRVFREIEKMGPEALFSLTKHRLKSLCLWLNNTIAGRKQNITAWHQLRDIPQDFPDTLWADVLEYAEIHVRLKKIDGVPDVDVWKEEIFTFQSVGWGMKTYDPMSEFLARWNPGMNIYYDENCPVRTDEFERRMNPVEEEYRSGWGTYVKIITKRKLLRALEWDMKTYLAKNKEGPVSEKAKTDTETYLGSQEMMLRIMRKVEALFTDYYWADHVEFQWWIQLTEEERSRIQTIQSAQGPVTADMG